MITSTNGFQMNNKDPAPANSQLSRGEQWLGSLTASVASQGPSSLPPRRPPALGAHTRSQSLGSPPEAPPSLFQANPPTVAAPAPVALPAIPPRSPFHTALHSSTSVPLATNSPPYPSASIANRTNPIVSDPFDAEWAALATRSPSNTNPFLQNSVVKTFEVRM